MRTLSLLGLLLLANPITGQAVAPPPRETDLIRRPPAKAGEFGGKTLAQWEAEIRAGGERRHLAASAAHAWGREAAPLAKALVETVPKWKQDDFGNRLPGGLELDNAAVFGALGPDAIAPLLDALKSPRPELRAAAVEGLSAIRPTTPRVVAALAATLGDPDHYVRRYAAHALEHLGPAAKDALPALAHRVLAYWLYSSALRSIHIYGAAGWVVVEAALAVDPHFWPSALLKADALIDANRWTQRDDDLLRLGPAANDVLRWAVRRSDPMKDVGRRCVVDLCLEIGPRSAPVLMEIMRYEYERARGYMIAAPWPYLQQVHWMKRRPMLASVNYFVYCAHSRIAAERQMCQPHFTLWVAPPFSAAALTLADFGAGAKEVAPELRRWLRGRDPLLRRTALHILTAMGDEEARKVALEVLESRSQVPGLRYVALDGLGRLRDPALIPYAVEALDTPHPLVPFGLATTGKPRHPLDGLPGVAVTALGRVGPAAREQAAALVRPLLTMRANADPDDDPMTAALALLRMDPTEVGAYRVWVLESGANSEYGRRLRSYKWPELNDEVLKHRDQAVKTLDKLAHELDGKDLWKLLGARVRLGAMEERHYQRLAELATVPPIAPGHPVPHNYSLFSLLEDCGPPAAPALARLLDHPEAVVRWYAAWYLAKLRHLDEPVGNHLARRLPTIPQAWTRCWLIVAVANADRKIALPALSKALADEDPSVRFQAAVMLADLDPTDPAVARTLLDLRIPEDKAQSTSWWSEGPTFAIPFPTGTSHKKLAGVRAEALYKTDPEAAVRAGIVSPFATGRW